MALQRTHHVKVASAYDHLDIFEPQIQLAIEKDLLQPDESIFIVIAITVLANTGRFKQPNFIIVVECTRCNTGQFGKLLHGEHADILNPNATLMSRDTNHFGRFPLKQTDKYLCRINYNGIAYSPQLTLLPNIEQIHLTPSQIK